MPENTDQSNSEYRHFLRSVLPKVYINLNVFPPELSYSGKIKVSLGKITSTFGLSSGAAQQNFWNVGMKSKLAWLIV